MWADTKGIRSPFTRPTSQISSPSPGHLLGLRGCSVSPGRTVWRAEVCVGGEGGWGGGLEGAGRVFWSEYDMVTQATLK